MCETASDPHVNPFEATEGLEITLTCIALEQLYNFYFSRIPKKLGRVRMWVSMRLTPTRQCSSRHVQVDMDTYYPGNSNTVNVSVKELLNRPVGDYWPRQQL